MSRVKLDDLEGARTLDDVLAWLNRVRESGGVDPPSTPEEGTRFAAKVQSLKRDLCPRSHPSVVAALEAAIAKSASADFRAAILAVPRADEFKRAFEELALIVGRVRDATTHARPDTKSRRAAHATRARDSELFTVHAGKVSMPAEAAKDAFGNASDDTYQLARDGACAGLKAVVLILMDQRADRLPETWYTRFTGMLQRKGLDVAVFSIADTNPAYHPFFPPLSARQLRHELANAAELWVISGARPLLTHDHLRVIVAAWKAGMGLYIAGDNDPYTKDANRLLRAVGLPFMSGNFLGRTVLTRENGTLLEHFLTTGIAGGLFSGVTVADFDVRPKPAKCVSGTSGTSETSEMPVALDTDVRDADDVDDTYAVENADEFFKIVHEDGRDVLEHVHPIPVLTARWKLIKGPAIPYKVIAYTGEVRPDVGPCAGILVHEGSEYSGRVIADGAFTRLCVDWDKHGTPQYVGNAACYLASSAVFGHGHESAPSSSSTTPEVGFDYADAPSFECAVTHEDTQSSGFVMLYGESPFSFLSNEELCDPLGVGLRLGADIVSTEVLCGEELGELVRETRCPFTRRTVLVTIPLVRLRSDTNQRLLSHILTGAFTDGSFARAAWFMFFGVCVKAMVRAEAESVSVSVSGSGAGAGTVRGMSPYRFLVEEMLDNVLVSASFSSAGPFVPMRQAITAYAQPSAADPFSRLRRFPLSTIVDGLAPFVTDPSVTLDVWTRQHHVYTAVQTHLKLVKLLGRKAFVEATNRDWFKCSFGCVPIAGTAKPTGPDAVSDLTWCDLLVRVVLGRKTTAELNQKPEAFLLQDLKSGDGLLYRAWEMLPVDLTRELESQFAHFAEASTPAVPGFATIYGPSVVFDQNGQQFLEGTPLSDMYKHVDLLSTRRREKLAGMYGYGASAVHAAHAANYPLHLCVRVVMNTQFRDAVEYDAAQGRAVAEALLEKGSGNLYTSDFEEIVEATVRSYLRVRLANMALAVPLPEKHQQRISFRSLLAAELAVLGVASE